MRPWYVATGWALVALVVWGSLAPSPPSTGSDKLGHFGAYALLMFWFAQLYRARLAWAAGLVGLGVLLEFAQGWVGYRSFELADMLANAVGVALGWGTALILPTVLPGAERERR